MIECPDCAGDGYIGRLADGYSCPMCLGAGQRPKIVCLCGSTKFKQEFIEANFQETMQGNIVLTVGWFSHADGQVYTPTAEEKKELDELHLRKIDLADEVLILNVGGYIGESMQRELDHAREYSKRVRFLEPQHKV